MAAPVVELYVDPSCPFAWLAARWLLEVEHESDISLGFSVMSLGVLNEDRDLDAWYRDFCDKAWGPARVAVAVQQQGGKDALRAFYLAYGRHFHDQRNKDHAAAIREGLAAAELSADLADVANGHDIDDALRAEHGRAIDGVGEDLGTPALFIDGRAVFGPVLTAVPKGRDALALFDAVRTFVALPQVAEIKRARSDELSFD